MRLDKIRICLGLCFELGNVDGPCFNLGNTGLFDNCCLVWNTDNGTPMANAFLKPLRTLWIFWLLSLHIWVQEKFLILVEDLWVSVGVWSETQICSFRYCISDPHPLGFCSKLILWLCRFSRPSLIRYHWGNPRPWPNRHLNIDLKCFHMSDLENCGLNFAFAFLQSLLGKLLHLLSFICIYLIDIVFTSLNL